MRRLKLVGIIAIFASLLVTASGVADADHVPAGLVVTDVERGTIEKGVRSRVGGITVRTRGPADLVTVEGTFEKGGGSAGWHTHPGPVFVIVRSGTLTVWDENCKGRRYSKGDAFFEQGPDHSMLVKNESPTEDATFYATFIVPVGANPLAVPSPHRCGLEQ